MSTNGIMASSKIIKDLLDEYRSRLGLDGSSAVLAHDEDLANTIETWCKGSYMSYMPGIKTMAADTSAEKWPYKEDSFSHIFAQLQDASKTTLQYLKWIQWSLKYKGIAVLILSKDFNLDHGSTVNFIENASFERGRIRVLDRQVQSEGESHTGKVVIAMKWDILSA